MFVISAVFNKLFRMKILVIFFCFLSTKSVFSMNGLPSPQQLIHSRRRFSPANPHHNLNSEIIKLLFLKRLLELDCLRNIHYRHCEVVRYLKRQKLPTAMKFDGTSTNKNIHPVIISNGVRRKFLIKPKIVIVPPVNRIWNNFQNRKGLNYKKNFSEFTSPLSEETKEDKKEKSFEKDFGLFLENITKIEEKDKLLHRSPVIHSKITSDLDSKPKPTEMYEVEEIIEDTVNIDESNFNEMKISDYGNRIKSNPKEKAIINSSIQTIIKEMTGPETNSPLTGNILNEDSETKAPVQTTAPPKLLYLTPVVKKVFSNENVSVKNTQTVQKHSDRRMNQQLFPIREQENLKPLNKAPEVTNIDGENKHKIENIKLKTAPQTFFGFFNKGPTENIKQKLTEVSENSNSFTSSRPLTNVPGRNQHFLKNLVTDDENPEMVVGPSSTAQSVSQTLTVTVQIDNMTLVPRALNTQFPLTVDPVNHNAEEMKTTTGTLQISTTSNTNTAIKELSDAPLSINLLSTTVKSELKKEQESNGKNSRKMHFDQETISNMTESYDPELRRSDILIMDDYKDDDNSFTTLTYFEKIHPNGTIDDVANATIDFFIPLIPEILNGIREDKISSQDLSLLSNVFGKYWTDILALSNNTELDVLPLITMKNEKDLINVIERHLSNEPETFTTEIVEVKLDRKDSQKQYDYMDEYKDLYDYVLKQDKRKRHRDEEEYDKLEVENDFEILNGEEIKRAEYE